MNQIVKRSTLVTVGVATLVIGFLFGKGWQVNTLGISFQEPSFGTATHAEIACSASNASTSVLVAGNRLSFMAFNDTANKINLCRHGVACSATSGIPLYPSSSVASRPYVQTDNYTGYYTCRAEGSDATLDIDYRQ